MKNPFSVVRKWFAAGYDAAEDSRHQPRLPYNRTTPRDEDSTIGHWDRTKLRQRCRDLRRNDAVTAGIITRFSDNVVGNGIIPQAKTSDSSWNEEAEEFYRQWSKVADSRQRVNMRALQKIAVEERLISGDLGFVMTTGGQLQPIEGERIATPSENEKDGNVFDGVKVDKKTGLTLGYYVFPRESNGAIDVGSKRSTFIRREDFVFCMKPSRFDMVRGIPELAPCINSIQYVHDLQMATLEKSKMDAFNGWFIGSENNVGPGNLGARNASKAVDAPTYETFKSGRNFYGRPGEAPISLASNTPNPQYMAFLEKSLRIIGSALGLPYEFVLLDFSQGSYSSSRAALLQTYRTFSDWQEWLASSFLQRTWNWRIAKAIKEKRLRPAPIGKNGISEWFKVDWSFPEFGWVDPQNEAQANLLEYQLGTNTITQMNRKKGRDVEDVFREKGAEIAFAHRIADETNKQYGTKLTWKDFISAQIPGQMSAPAADIKTTDKSDMDEDKTKDGATDETNKSS